MRKAAVENANGVLVCDEDGMRIRDQRFGGWFAWVCSSSPEKLVLGDILTFPRDWQREVFSGKNVALARGE